MNRCEGHRQRYLDSDLPRHRFPLDQYLHHHQDLAGPRGGRRVKYYFLIGACCSAAVAVSCVHRDPERCRTSHPGPVRKRVVGRKMYGRQSTHIPIKVNMSGVMRSSSPVRFNLHPGYHRRVLPEPVQCGGPSVCRSIPADVQHPPGWVYATKSICCSSLHSTFYHGDAVLNPVEIANNLRNNNGTIPGYRR